MTVLPFRPLSREAQRFFGHSPFDLDRAIHDIVVRAARRHRILENRGRIRAMASDIRERRAVTPKEGAR